MSRVVPYAITLFGLACMAFIVVGISQPVPHPETYLAVTDKPYVEVAKVAQEEAEAYEPEPYYEPTYYSYYDSQYDDMTDQEYIAWRESGWDYEARNGRYIGKYQMDESRLDGDWSPEHQEEVAEQYMLDRYGSWEAAREFWDSHGWW